MKKAIIALLISISLSSISAEVFDSNALGQNLGEKDQLAGTGYEGESNAGVTTIYLDGVPIRTRTETESGYRIEEDGYSLSVILDSSGRRIRDITEEGGAITERSYSYDGSRLSAVTVSDGDGIERIIEYVDTPAGHLAGLSGAEHGYLTPYYYVYSLDGDSINVSFHSQGREERPSFVPDPAVYSVDESGNWTGTTTDENGAETTRTYSPDGLLMRMESGEESQEYTYDEDGELILLDSRSGSERTVSEYADGHLIHEDSYIDDVIQKSRTYNDDGSVEEIRYADGVRKSLILFDSDGLRIRRVETFR